jgi:GNAT superfamily N-acetyltransferase
MLIQYENEIKSFLEMIPDQTEFFDLTMDRFLQSKLCIIYRSGTEVAGMVGMLPRKGFMSVYIVVKQKFQGKGIARNLSNLLIEAARQKYHILSAVIALDNDISLHLHQSLGYKLIGQRDKFYYTFLPLDSLGRVIMRMIKGMFPAIKFIDRLRV